MSFRDKLYTTTRGALSRLGLSVEFDRPVRNPMKLLALKAEQLGIRTMLDIGANKGQFATALRGAGFSGRIVSFEPLSAIHEMLTAKTAHKPDWILAPRMALGDAPGNTQINVSRNLASSSLLKVSKRSTDAAPESGYVGVDDVDVRRLDDVIMIDWAAPFAMKLDTQGFEMHVLRGAEQTLAKTALLIVELSLTPLYAGGASLPDVFLHLGERGFRCISIVQGFADNAAHEVLQVDGIFVRDRPSRGWDK